MEKKLEVKNLQVSFRTQGGILKAVRDISFDLYKGETLAIVGESGSGKSVTSKAIIGILSNNSIVEGGEILYDGQDLLKIDEEHFHKIRGDKISMIFQDPLSSLNPIMRIGKQLTEAMILNGKARQKHAREDFNRHLKNLRENLNTVSPEEVTYNNEQCKIFDSFCILSTQLELEYNNAQHAAITLKSHIENVVFLIEKRQKVDLIKECNKISADINDTVHNFVVSKESADTVAMNLKVISSAGKGHVDAQELVSELQNTITVLDEGIAKKAPNFFRLGYYLYKNGNLDSVTFNTVEELDEYMKKYLDEEFMIDFITLASKGIRNSYDTSIEAKKQILAQKDYYVEYFAQENLNEKDALRKAKELSKLVNNAINYLSIHKKGVEYSFESTIKHDLNVYFKALKTNPKMQARYDKQLRKYNKIVEAGKNPTWKINPPLIVDLELARKNINRVINNLFANYERTIARSVNYDVKAKTIELIDELKELASRVVYKISKSLAKVKAIELMKEVGIPEPAIRFKQYPFEFSGGMRQRIVIAIALSANPDILICDEPTTALDVTIQSQILELINKIKKERNLSVIFITHDLGVVANMADRIAVMYAGKIVEYGTADDIFYDPRHPYTWALLSSMPDLDTKEKLDAIPGTPPNMIYPPIGDAFAERNKYALEIDYEMQPPMFKVNDTHFAATWLLHPNAPKVNPPKVITDRIERMKKEGSIVMEQKVLLKVENLEQYFKMGKRSLKAVDNVSFDIYKGEVFGVVGESGCGKTTTGRSVIRLYDITGGSIYFDGERIAAGVRRYKQAIADAKKDYTKKITELRTLDASDEEKAALKAQYTEELIAFVDENTKQIKKARYDHRNCNKEFAKAQVRKVEEKYNELLSNAINEEERQKLENEKTKEIKLAKKDRIMNKIQMIFQDPIASLDPRMTVHDIIAEGLIIRGIKDKKYITNEVYRVLELVGLVPEHATRYPHEFSGGQRQRIGIARAIILNPELIIADEPISALDVSIQAQVINLMNDLRDKMGLTIMFIAHDLSVVKYFADRIAVMYFGKMVELATSDELFAHPLHPYTKSLLSAIPLPDPHYEKNRKRITYNPLADHDYSKEGPTMREVSPGHFIYCNSEEFERYKKEVE